MTETALEMAASWGELPDGTQIDALSDMARLTAEIICRSIFGAKLGRERTREVIEGFAYFQHLVSRLDIPSLFGLPDWFPRMRKRDLHRAIKRIHRVLDEIVAEYSNRPDTAEASAIGSLINARDPETGEPLDARAVRNEVAVIFLAGHETTASTLAFALFLLSQAPDVEARLHAELDEVLTHLSDRGTLRLARQAGKSRVWEIASPIAREFASRRWSLIEALWRKHIESKGETPAACAAHSLLQTPLRTSP